MKLSSRQAVLVIFILCVVEIGGLAWLTIETPAWLNQHDDLVGVKFWLVIHLVLFMLLGIVSIIYRFYDFLTGQ
ncbi:MAG: hypothetical protein A3D65_01440 [Candidatus Lloydbacteria bacterium RIFCSPHIGHO2_02_FULL_50_13]|uniref:Uncharacterized protein n=1 Tax=Candidatus Lloydbacteria bacterium RIFCSPHIGHO2_02_FULL_50_13 TaxID=1798661 RepID=A0A1G2D4Q8_9BACT|nr:MAG: hypothetical protein A3D65_01440 [Candidatus Lloydbacteria bacterium RIFCSPHIGHO2_02_FULL_50_13]